jgi:hypothetical protein
LQVNHSKAKSTDDEDEDEEEINLATFYNKKKKKKGKWKKKGFEGKDDDTKCKHCSRKGHQADKCWMLDKNKGKRPDWFDQEKYCQKKEKEVSNAAVNHSREGLELLLMAMSFPKALDLLDDPNVWIADTAASCDSTPCSRGAANIRNGNGGVIFGNRKNNNTDVIFDWRDHGNKILMETLQNIKHVKSAKFNLFSLTTGY